MKIEFNTESNELKVDGKTIDKATSSLMISDNCLKRLDGNNTILGHFIDLNIKFYKPIIS